MNRIQLRGAQFVLALLLAMTLWTYVSFSTNPTSTKQLQARVDASGLQKGLMVVNSGTGLPEDFVASTVVTLSGPREDIAGVDEADVRASVDLSGAGPGVHQLEVDVDPPRFTQVRSKRPEEITVRLARELSSTVPVTVSQQGEPPFSFSVGAITLGADEAVVRGPEDRVKQVVGAVVAVNLQGQTRDLEATLPVQPVDRSGAVVEGVTLAPERAAVRVAIEAEVDVQQVSVVPAFTGQPATGYALGSIDWTPKIVEVFTAGGISGTLSTEEIDLTGLTSSITRTVSLSNTGNVITRPQNVQVTVRVAIVPIGVRSQLPMIIAVSHIGLSKELDPEAYPSSVRITVAGLFERLSSLTPDEVTATVDLTGYGPGTYIVPVAINLPPGLELISQAAPEVTVVIAPVPPTPTPEPTPTFPFPTSPPPDDSEGLPPVDTPTP